MCIRDRPKPVVEEKVVEEVKKEEQKVEAAPEIKEEKVESKPVAVSYTHLDVYKRQNHIGSEVEVLTKSGKKLAGVLKEADEEKFVVTVQKKVKLDGAKRPKLMEEDETFRYDEIKYTKYLISFK